MKKPKVIFAPGCFDEFEGTQEELDNLIKEITEMAESGELMSKSIQIEEIPEEQEQLVDVQNNVRH